MTGYQYSVQWQPSASVKHSYVYSATNNDGKLSSRTDNISGEQVQYLYDSLSRLSSATAGSWSQQYIYDGFGNMNKKTGTGQAQFLGFDAPLNSATNNGGPADGDMEDRRTDGGWTMYAADNKRIVRLMSGAESRRHVYLWVGNMRVGTYQVRFPEGSDMVFTVVKEDLYVAGRRVAPSDRLGSDLSGGLKLLPYGEELQPTKLEAGPLLTLEYGYAAANDGNMVSQKITRLDAGQSRVFTHTFGYDALSRLKSAAEGTTWAQQYVYDRLGNRALLSSSSNPHGSNLTPQVLNDDPLLVTQQFPGNRWAPAVGPAQCYDSSGNLVGEQAAQGTCSGNVAPASAVSKYWYDAEARLVEAVTPVTASTKYEYDAEGRRVRKVAGTAQTVFVYDGQGQLAAEYDSATSGSSPGIQYLTQDHLGSTRLITNAGGAATECIDYLPFGSEIPASWGNRAGGCYSAAGSSKVRLKFTGNERDAETGLDYFGARYFSGAQGRFTSPDEPLLDQNPENPQSWNLYAYGRNNPLRNRDLDGRVCVFGIGNTCDEKLPSPPPPPPPPAPRNPVYPTPDQAGIAAARLNQQKQQQTGSEHASSVHTVGPAYTYTDPVTQGQATTVDPNNTTGQRKTKPVDLGQPPIPGGTQLVGESHSHPTESNFSFFDVQRGHDLTLKVYGHPLFQGMYLGLPSGEVRKYDPSTGKIIVVAPKTGRR